MAKVVDKAVVANWSALVQKYGVAGATQVDQAVGRLVAADARRGLMTRLVYIDDAGRMKPFGGNPVASAGDARSVKAAVDAIYQTWTPDYLVLLDGPDVIPHVILNPIPGLENDDPNVPSDLPYASAAPWALDASKFLAVTRVVGRIPAAAGTKSPDALIKILDAAAAHVPAPPSAHAGYFAISAAVWKGSTSLSITNSFGGDSDMFVCPDDSHPKIDPNLQRLSHFINCHGATADARFYGQRLANYPVAMESAKLAPNVRPGTVVAAECCFGAQLYDYTIAGTAPPICMAYLAGGAVGFLGSTNTAYGPAEGNGQADLLTQYFMQQVLTGSSLGRALLEARQKFIRTQIMASPSNLKTIAQYLLLGDPSVQPCLRPADVGPASKSISPGPTVVDEASARKSRRLFLHGEGLAVAATASRPGRVSHRPSKLAAEVSKLAADHGFGEERVAIIEALGTRLLGQSMKQLNLDRKVAVIVQREEPADGQPVPSIRLFTAHILAGTVVSVETAERR